MLNKLVKYEFKSTGRILPLIYLAVIALSLCVGVSLRNSMFTDEGVANLLTVSIYVILVVALIVVTIIVIIARFYRSMISQEGYLMHTLPVKPWQHIVSKACMAIIWTAIAVVVIIVSLLIIGGISGMLAELRDEFIVMMTSGEMEFFLEDKLITMMIICAIVQGIRYILQAYAAMAIGGSSTKNKIAYSFLAFVVLAVITSAIASIVSMGIIRGLFASNGGMMEVLMDAVLAEAGVDFNGFMNGLFAMQLIMDGAFSVVFFILTNHFLKNKLNLE